MFIGMSAKLITNGHLQINTEYGQWPNKSNVLNTITKYNYNTSIHTQKDSFKQKVT